LNNILFLNPRKVTILIDVKIILVSVLLERKDKKSRFKAAFLFISMSE